MRSVGRRDLFCSIPALALFSGSALIAGFPARGDDKPPLTASAQPRTRSEAEQLHSEGCRFGTVLFALRLRRQEGGSPGIPGHRMPAGERLRSPARRSFVASTASKGVAFLGINSNAHESEAASEEQARKFGLDFPVLKDPRNVVADLALVERTPEVLVLDGRARVRYRGAIDDQYSTGTRKPEASHHYLEGCSRRPARRPADRGGRNRGARMPARPRRARRRRPSPSAHPSAVRRAIVAAE